MRRKVVYTITITGNFEEEIPVEELEKAISDMLYEVMEGALGVDSLKIKIEKEVDA